MKVKEKGGGVGGVIVVCGDLTDLVRF